MRLLWLHAEYRVYTSHAPVTSTHAADQEQEINFVQPKIVPGSRGCAFEGWIKEVLLY